MGAKVVTKAQDQTLGKKYYERFHDYNPLREIANIISVLSTFNGLLIGGDSGAAHTRPSAVPSYQYFGICLRLKEVSSDPQIDVS
jgi:hypothetical protein